MYYIEQFVRNSIIGANKHLRRVSLRKVVKKKRRQKNKLSQF